MSSPYMDGDIILSKSNNTDQRDEYRKPIERPCAVSKDCFFQSRREISAAHQFLEDGV